MLSSWTNYQKCWPKLNKRTTMVLWRPSSIYTRKNSRNTIIAEYWSALRSGIAGRDGSLLNRGMNSTVCRLGINIWAKFWTIWVLGLGLPSRQASRSENSKNTIKNVSPKSASSENRWSKRTSFLPWTSTRSKSWSGIRGIPWNKLRSRLKWARD